MTDLSPQAQAVLDAVTAQLDWDARYHSHSAAAAALRAVADQVTEKVSPVEAILAIANELDS